MSTDDTKTHSHDELSLKDFRHAHQLCDYWQSLRTEHSVPLRSAFRPQNIINLLPFIMLLENVSGTDSFTFRIVGTSIEGILPTLKTGSNLDMINEYDTQQLIAQQARKTLSIKQPVFFEGALGPKSHLPMPDYGMIMVPFSSEADKCDLVMCLFDFKSSIKPQS